jgi:thiosulfate dehydrogenase [quinone] large subunit
MPRPPKRRRPNASGRRAPAAPPPASLPQPPSGLAATAQIGRVLLPLRLFLGATFVYAGLQKLTDSGFLQAGSRTYIGAQLQGFAPRSPIGGLLNWIGANVAIETGLIVIVVELVVGAAVLVGFRTRWFATAGAVLNLLLFLSATWDVFPYFLGSDSIYAAAWITLAIAGDGGVWSVERRWRATVDAPVDDDRRKVLLQLGGAAVAAIWLLGLLPRGKAPAAISSLQPPSSPTPSATSPGASPTTSAAPTATAAPSGLRIGSLADLQNQGSLSYTDPKSGDPAVAVALGNNQVVAFDAVCTHAGCTVQYDPSQRVLYCPCHGAAFDPAHSAAVLQGPASTPLGALVVTVAADGNVYAANTQ